VSYVSSKRREDPQADLQAHLMMLFNNTLLARTLTVTSAAQSGEGRTTSRLEKEVNKVMNL